MKEQDLKIGNLIDLYGKQVRVIGIDKTLHGDYHVTYNDGEKDYRTARYLDQFEPIPLTEEWLEIVNGFSFGEDLSFAIWADKNGVSLEQYGEGRMRLFHVKYVHQLQNLYFALTGEELELKP